MLIQSNYTECSDTRPGMSTRFWVRRKGVSHWASARTFSKNESSNERVSLTDKMAADLIITEDLFNPKDSQLSLTTNLHPVPQNLFSTEGARGGPIWTVILQMLFQIFPLEFLTTILWARHISKITLLQVILRKEEQFLKHWTFLNMNLHKLIT